MALGASIKLDESGNGNFVNNLDEVDLALIQDLVDETGNTILDTDIGSNIQFWNKV